MALFRPFRALGYVTNETPFAIQRRGKETFLTVSVGQAWQGETEAELQSCMQIFNAAKMTLALVGPELPGSISALANHGDLTFAAVGGEVIECKRLHRCGQYSGHDGEVLQLMVLGDLLLSLGADRKLCVWQIGIYDDPQHVVELSAEFKATCMAHPDTYLNKIVIGGADGRLQLWNFISGKQLYEFNLGSSSVCCIVPSPALDVVGIGMADGRAVLHNLKYDEQVASFANASGAGAKSKLYLNPQPASSNGGGGCTGISFRAGAGVPLMAAGGSSGAITVWNLEEKKLQTIIRDAHDGPLLSLHFFAGEPRLMSSAEDNSIKQWLFDNPDGTARLLRFRSGHSAPPTVLRSYGDGNRLLSGGQDRAFRMFSTIQDQQSRELSQGHIERKAKRLKVEQAELKLPPLLAMDACQVRERDWANIITAHQDDSSAYTWRLQKFCLSEHILSPPQSATQNGKLSVSALPTPVTCVSLSSCGNFGFVGSQAGRLDRYNMQSGLHRGTYNRVSASGKAVNAHDGPVTGVAVDGCNKLVISCSHDTVLRIWDFKKQRLNSEIRVGSMMTKLAMHPGTALIAVADDTKTLRMFDIETRKQVRTFSGHTGHITDLSIGSDGRWLMSSAEDETLRVWDIPAARILQVVQFGSAVSSFSLSPTQELLATTHAGRNGIYLWANHYVYGGAAGIIPSDKPVNARLPAIQTDLDGEGDDVSVCTDDNLLDSEGQESQSIGGMTGVSQYKALQRSGAPQPLSAEMVTLSLLPRTQWQNLVHLDAIKERSRPTEPPKKPEAAPFFLPTVASTAHNPVFDTAEQDPDEQPASSATHNVPGWGDENETSIVTEGLPVIEDRTTGKRKKKSKSTDPNKKSRVLQNATSESQDTEFLMALRRGGVSGDFSEFVALLRSLSPVAVDQHLQAMQIIDLDTAEPQDVENLALVMQMCEKEVEAGCSFEHIQALLRAFLNIHGDTLNQEAGLKDRADALQEKLGICWARLSSKLHHVRCLVNFLGGLPLS